MASCNIQQPLPEIADAINKQQIENLMSGKAESLQEVINRLEFFNQNFEKKEIPIEQVRLQIGKYLVKDTGGKANVYLTKGGGAIIPETFTTEGSLKFEKTMGSKASTITNSADSIIKKDSGTIVHKALEDLINLSAKENGLLYKRDAEIKTIQQIQDDSGLDTNNFKELILVAKGLISDAIKTQNEIDPTKKPIIFTEQRLLENARRMGTSDLVIVYSDLTADHFDFKTMQPKSSMLEEGTNQLKDYNWIPFYKYEDWNLQLPKTTKALLNTVGLKKIRKSRVIPIQVDFEWNTKTKQITDKITTVKSYYSGDKFLMPIPVQEKVDSDNLQLSVDKLQRLKNNLEIELHNLPGGQPEKRNAIKAELERTTVAINKLIVEKDVRALLNDYNKVVKRFLTADEKLDAAVNDETSSKYLNLQELLDLSKEVHIFKDIVDSTMIYYSSLGLTPEEVDKNRLFIGKLTMNLGILTSKLDEEVLNRLMISPSKIEEIKNSKDISTISKLFDTFSEIRHPIFEQARERIFEAKNKSVVDLQKFKEKLTPILKNVEQWGRNNGYSGFTWYKALVDERTGNLYSKFNSKFINERNQALSEKDSKFIKKYYKLKDDAVSILERSKQNYILTFGLDVNDEVDAKKIKSWERENTFENLITNPKLWFIYYDLKPEYSFENGSDQNLKEIYSDEYFKIQRTPALKEFYNFWTSSMRDFRYMLGFGKDYEILPDNFLPWVRADIATLLFQDETIHGVKDQISQIFSIMQDNMEFGDTYVKGKLDIESGEPLHEIPRWFVKPLFNKNNEVDTKLKSYDLGNVLYTFASVAFNYESLKKIEPEVNALKEVLNKYGAVQTDSQGGIIKTKFGSALRYLGNSTEIGESFNKHLKYSMYGIKTQDKKVNPKVHSILTKANKLQVMQNLAMRPVTQISAGIASRSNAYFEGVKGYYYNKAQLRKSNILLSKSVGTSEESKVLLSLINFFEFASKSEKHKSIGLGGNKITNLVKKDIPFIGFRKGSELVDNTIGLSMLQNYGIAKDGNIKRISTLPEGSQSLLDLALKNSKESLVIPGIIEADGTLNSKTYSQFRTLVRKVSRGIKGEMDENDVNQINMSLLGQLMMTYKNWFPHLTKERFHKIKYDSVSNTATIGKYNAIWHSNLKPEHKGLLSIMQHTAFSMGRLALDITTFGALKNTSLGFNVNEERARQLFQKFKDENPDSEDIQNLSFEDFKDYMQGQIRSTITELRVMLSFVGLVLLAGMDWDDDEEPDYQKYWATRQTYRMLNRVKRELGFYYGSDALELMFKSPLPVSSHILTGRKFLQNSIDETLDIFSNDPDKRDKTPSGYYGLRLLPYHGLITTLFEPFKQDVDKEY